MEDEEWDGGWESRGRRAGRLRASLRRPSMPVTAAVCAGVLVIALVVAISSRATGDGDRPGNRARPSPTGSEAPAIDFAPIDDGPAGSTPPTSTPPSASPASRPNNLGGPLVTTVSPTSTPSRPVTFSAVGGYHCPTSSTIGFQHYGRYTDGDDGWYSLADGGWASDGCISDFEAMPMSGSATKDDPSMYTEWWFVVGSRTTECAVATYVPTAIPRRDAAGNPATFQVRDTTSSAVRATFTVNQSTNRGRWISVGTYGISGGQIVFRLVNRGQAWSASGITYDHIAVAQFRVLCY